MLEMMTSNILKKLNQPGLEIDPNIFQKLLASDGAAGDQFGYSVEISLDGTTIVIGAYLDDDRGSQSGSVYIFKKQINGNYLQTQKLRASDGVAYDYFGSKVAISADGTTIVIGAHFDDDKGDDSGSAYVFTKQANENYSQTQKLVASDGAAGDYFGDNLTVSGDGSIIAVSSWKDDPKGSDSGSVYVFKKQVNGSYLQTQKLIPVDGAANDYFGFSIDISTDGSTFVIASYQDDDKGSNSGSVYVFTKQVNGSYLQTQKLVALDGVASDFFGYSVAVSGNGSTVVVSATYDDDKGTNSGSVYVYTRQVNNSYLQTQKLVASDGGGSKYFGNSVAISEDSSNIVVGSHYDNIKGSGSGSAFIFKKQPEGNYLQVQKLVALDGATNNYFGFSVAVSKTSVVVGAYGNLGKGVVYVY